MTSRAEPLKQRADYYSIRDGSFRLPTSKDNPAAILREWKSPDGSREGVEYELGFKALYGRIVDVRFHENTIKDGKTFRNVNIVLDENEDGVAQIISMPLDSRYTADFLKKLPLVKLDEEIRLMPYDFEKDGPRQVGLSIYHKGGNDEFSVKVENNFFTKVEDKDGEKVYTNLHGFPEATDEDREDWPFYFKKVSKFLVNYTKEHIVPKFTLSEEQKADAEFDAMTGPIDPPEFIRKRTPSKEEIAEGIDLDAEPPF